MIITYIFSVLSVVFIREIMGYFIYIGTAVGFLAGNLIGAILKDSYEMIFTIGWIGLMFSIVFFAIIGIAISICNNVKENWSGHIQPKLRKAAVCIFSFIIINVAFFTVFFSLRRLELNKGRTDGYRAGYEQGVIDKAEGRTRYSGPNPFPDNCELGSSYAKGYMISWPMGYGVGYEESE